MMTAFVQHRVKDYDAWRRVYDSVVDMQKAGGVITESVYRSESDSNLVMVSHQFPNILAAHDFFASPALRDAMRRAGVEEDSLRIEFFEDGYSAADASSRENLPLPPSLARKAVLGGIWGSGYLRV